MSLRIATRQSALALWQAEHVAARRAPGVLAVLTAADIQADGLKSPDPQWFEPFSPVTARWTLIGITLGSLLIAAIIFQRREYRDLT